MKREAELKAELSAESDRTLRGFHHFYVAGVGRDGIPDRVWNAYGRTSWVEVKHATPDFDGTDQQVLECMRLEATSFCRYLIFYEDKYGNNKRTLIIRPRDVRGKHGRVDDMIAEAWIIGHDHRWACNQIKKWHQP